MKSSETWKTLVYDGMDYIWYQVSDLGRIRSLDRIIQPNGHRSYVKRGRILSLRHTKKDPHLFTEVSFFDDKELIHRRKTIYVHKAVYETFVEPMNGDEPMYVTHKDRDITRNYPFNLKSISHSELQKRNMKEHPEARMRLSIINKASGYLDSKRLPENKIKNIKALRKSLTLKEISEKLKVSLSSVYNYIT